MVKTAQVANISENSDKIQNMINTNVANQESDHDYGFTPRRNGHHSQENVMDSPSDSSGKIFNALCVAKHICFAQQ